ncbi:Abscisic acid-insensitive 5-like protein 3 [Vitis vinifera]|uniref:Abscisic acid-insensitive 5-like protein 3 n=1 Tax=Vitis vinifera TaxID=29760 RepID=A0A438E2E4_VITVI|nr:Abscisic acid-insensitive 5-like protein 3 [Vitis vinifera]
MEIQTMGSPVGGQLVRQSSWYSLTLDEVENQLGDLGKPLGSMNVDELLKNVWMAEANQCVSADIDNASSKISLQRQASLTIAQALSEKTVEEVWSDIQQGEKKKCGDDIKGQVREPTLGEMKLEDFLVKAAVFVKGLDIVGHKRDASMEKTVERRLKRKIKNRESAARSRARKQAYHNELVSKVSRLEEENLRLKKEKVRIFYLSCVLHLVLSHRL